MKTWLYGFIFFIITQGVTAMEERAVFAGGCFWCMQPPFDNLKNQGVIQVTVGYSGGDTPSPTYPEVSSGNTGHAESIEVVYDPDKISYNQLLEVFWKNIDPTVKDQQFCDKGNQYRSAIFYINEKQKEAALASKQQLASRFENIYTEIVPYKNFHPAEDYHQNYYLKHPFKYAFYKKLCGRDKRLQEVWNTP